MIKLSQFGWRIGFPLFLITGLFFSQYVFSMNATQAKYYTVSKDERMNKIKQGMQKKNIHKLIRAKEFQGLEGYKGGFVIALNKNHNEFYHFPDWSPPKNIDLEFYISDKRIVMVYYDNGGKAQMAANYIRVIEQTLEAEAAPVIKDESRSKRFVGLARKRDFRAIEK